jgi:hypothetical protein
MTRLDAFDKPFPRLAALHWPKQDSVAGRHNMSLIGRQGFQKAPRGALVDQARFILSDGAGEPKNAQHASAAASFFVDVEMNAQPWFVLVGQRVAANSASPD